MSDLPSCLYCGAEFAKTRVIDRTVQEFDCEQCDRDYFMPRQIAEDWADRALAPLVKNAPPAD